MSGQAYQLALTEEEIGTVLKFCGQQALLVGGQALASGPSSLSSSPRGNSQTRSRSMWTS